MLFWWLWWCTSFISALERLRQESWRFEINLCHTERSWLKKAEQTKQRQTMMTTSLSMILGKFCLQHPCCTELSHHLAQAQFLKIRPPDSLVSGSFYCLNKIFKTSLYRLILSVHAISFSIEMTCALIFCKLLSYRLHAEKHPKMHINKTNTMWRTFRNC